MFDDLTPENQRRLADPNYRPPGAVLILIMLAAIPCCWALVIAFYVFAIRVLGPALAAIGSVL